MENRRTLEVAVELLSHDRVQVLESLASIVSEEDWITLAYAANELRVIDVKLELLTKLLEKMPGN